LTAPAGRAPEGGGGLCHRRNGRARCSARCWRRQAAQSVAATPMNHHVYVAGAPTLVGALTRRPGPRLWWPLDAAFGVCRGRQQRHQAAQRYLCPGAPAGNAGLLRRRTMNEDRAPLVSAVRRAASRVGQSSTRARRTARAACRGCPISSHARASGFRKQEREPGSRLQ